MQIQQSLGSAVESGRRENIVIVVRGFEEGDREVGVRGIEPAIRRETAVFLTTAGPEAENPRRISIDKLRKGYRVQRQTLKLEEGGVVAFSRAVRTGEGTYEAPWPEVLAYDRQQAKETLARFEYGCVVMFDEPKPDRSPGDLFVFHPERGFVAGTPDEVAAGTAEYFGAEAVRGHTLLVRAHPGDPGEQAPATQMPRALVVKDGDRWRAMSAEEAAGWASGCASRLAGSRAGCRFSVVPVSTWRLSKMLDPAKVRVPAMAYYTEAGGQRVYGARTTCVKLSGVPGDEERFVNAFFVEGPYGQRGGIDPDTLPVPGQ